MDLTLELVKKHLEVDADYTDDDEYIEGLMDVAYKMVEKHIDNDIENLIAFNNGEIPAPVVHAMLLFIGNMYMNRESVSYAAAHDIPLSYEYLLAPYHNYNMSKL